MGRSAVAHAVAWVYLGEAPTLRECLLRCWQCAGNVMLATIITLLYEAAIYCLALPVAASVIFIYVCNDSGASWPPIVAGILLVVFPFFLLATYILYLNFALAPSSIAIENILSTESLKRSWLLVGSTEYVLFFFCSNLCIAILFLIVNGITEIGIGSATTLNGSTVFDTLVHSAVRSISLPLFSILETVVYLNFRVTKEGLTADCIRRNTGRSHRRKGQSAHTHRT